jgi:hypothetical protein
MTISTEITTTNCYGTTLSSNADLRTGAIRFFSATYRLFHIPELEDACEDHG